MPQPSRTQTTADTAWKHARSCKKPLNDCATCKAGIAYFRSLSLTELSTVLQDRIAPAMPASLPLRGNNGI